MYLASLFVFQTEHIEETRHIAVLGCEDGFPVSEAQFCGYL